MRLHHVTLIVTDLAAATDFYHGEFDLQPRAAGDLDYPGAFLRINAQQELHLAELPDAPPSFRGHFCLRIPDFSAVFHRFHARGALEFGPWGKLRELPGGILQMYVRDPSGNLVELNSEPEDRSRIDPAIFRSEAWGGEPYRYGGG